MKALVAVMALLWVGCVVPVETPMVDGSARSAPSEGAVAGRVNSLGMRFVPVMGLNPNIQFAVWETRVKDYAAFAKGNADVDPRWSRPGFKQADDHPATFVNLPEAQAFCAWLTKKELAAGKLAKGQRYRLPTDAEWTAAVNSPVLMVSAPAQSTEAKYPWGAAFPPLNAGNYGVRLRQDYFFAGFVPGLGVQVPMMALTLKGDLFVYTSPVGSFEANANGLHDLGGNVWEWVIIKRPPVVDAYALRGASWREEQAVALESANRRPMDPPEEHGKFGEIGFRCVLDLGDTIKPPPPPVFVNSMGMKLVPVKGLAVQFSIHETRVREFEKFAQAMDLAGEWRTGKVNLSGSHPAVNVSWNEAKAFCAWLTAVDRVAGRIEPGQRYRLPTDSEWSVAVGLPAEFGASPRDRDMSNDGVYPWGAIWPAPAGVGNFGGVFGTEEFRGLSAAGSFAANDNGLHDLGGNAWEWVEDRWFPGSALRVLRGAWRGDKPRSLQSSHRFYDTPRNRGARYGFRVVLENAPQP